MDILISVGLPLGLAFIMFSLGVGLVPDDFREVVRRPVAFLIGAAHQVLLIPVVTFLVILLFGIGGELAVGFMILAACPGGVTSNVVSRLARADAALSVSLTAVISLASIVTVPVILAFAIGRFMGADAPEVNIVSTAITMFALTVVPILLGLGLRAAMPARMDRIEPTLVKIATVLFVLIVGAALAGNWGLFVENLGTIGGALILLVILLGGLGYVIPKLLGRRPQEVKTISIETAIQNSTLGITVATILVGAEGFTAYSIPAAVYGILMYLMLIPVVTVFRR